jgi:hypothetical protein
MQYLNTFLNPLREEKNIKKGVKFWTQRNAYSAYMALTRLTLVFVAGCVMAKESIKIYPAPIGEPISTDFTLTANRRNVPVYLATVATADPIRRLKIFTTNDTSYADHTSFASFDMQGTVEITVTCPKSIKSAKLLPSSNGLTPVIAGNRVTFTISKPQQLALEVNGGWVHCLQLFANPMETDVPQPDNPDVIYFAPGIHMVENVKVYSGKTVYLAGGAVIYGRSTSDVRGGSVFSLMGSNIVLRGRGIIDGSLCPRHTSNLVAVNGTNILLEGVILRDSSTWTVPIRSSERVSVKNIKLFGVRANSDGIDICDSQKVNVSNCYLRTMDDLVVVKTNKKGGGTARDIEVRHCVLWNELAHALSIGAELRENVANVHFSDCDVIHDKGREWLLRVYHCDAADIRDVTFDNIRVEESKRLISLWIGKAIWSRDEERGHVENITFRNIRAVGPDPRVELKGFDQQHEIRGVLLENIVINGRQIKLSDIKQNEFVQDVVLRP